jgi:hypothetical protein
MRKKSILLLGIVLVFVFQTVTSQEKIYFPYFEMINIPNDAELQYSMSKLLKTYIEENHSNYTVIIPKRDGYELYGREDFLESIENAKKNDAKYLLVGEVNNIGKVAIVTLSLFDVSTGNKIWSDLIKGMPIDDFDPVLSRIGRNFNTSVKARDDADIYDVTTYEEERETKLLNFKANSFTGIGLGGTYLSNGTVDTRFGLDFFYDVSSIILFINFEYATNSLFNFLILEDSERNSFLRNSVVNFSMGAAKPLTKKRNTPYVAGGLDYLIMTRRRIDPKIHESGTGLGLTANVGYLIARTSTTNFRFDLGLTFPTFKFAGKQEVLFKFGIITSFSNGGKK